MFIRIHRLIVIIVLALPTLGKAMGIDIHPTASVSLGNGVIDMGCRDATIVGTVNLQSGAIINMRHLRIAGGNLNAGNGQLALSGSWTNHGKFTPGTSLVTIQDGCSTTVSAMEGDTAFSAFSATSVNGKILQPVAGSTQVFYSSLTLRGDMGNPLLVQSSSEGQEAFFSLDASGTQDIVAVDVADNDASGGQSLIAGSLSGTESMDLGNNSNWVLALPPIEFVPVPTLSRWALMILSLVLVSAGLRRRHAVLNGNKWAI